MLSSLNRQARRNRADLALLEVAQEDPVHAPGQEPGQSGLAMLSGSLQTSLAVADCRIVELDLMIVLSAVLVVEIGTAVTPSSTARQFVRKFIACFTRRARWRNAAAAP